METIQTIYKRKSTRYFKRKSINKKTLEEILDAGIQAPSPKNDQPWRFLVVEEQSKKEVISDILENQLEILKKKNEISGIYRDDIISAFESARVLKEAAVIVFVYLDAAVFNFHDDKMQWTLSAKDVECTHIMAIGAAIQNMLLAATEKGVDSLWIGDIFYAYNNLKTYLCKEECLMAAVAFGYKSKVQCKSSRKGLDAVVTIF